MRGDEYGQVRDTYAVERRRQASAEDWSAEHDDRHTRGELAIKAAELAVHGTDEVLDLGCQDEWGLVVKHRGDRVRQLVIAGALLAAEIDRVMRHQGRENGHA